MATPPKHGRIAFITTPDFRTSRRESAECFIYRNMYSLCMYFSVLTTGRTQSELLDEILDRPLSKTKREHREMMGEDMRVAFQSQTHLDQWKDVVRTGLEKTMSGYRGMIHVAYELVEGRLDAVLHLTDWVDKSAKPDSAVLSREANVHNVPAATDVDTATAFIKSWHASIAKASKRPRLFRERTGPDKPPLHGLEPRHKVLALVAHDNMKLEMCCFAVEHAAHIFDLYEYILATGTTGKWLKKYMKAAQRGRDEINRIRCCYSGPKGGDLQIAYAVVKGLCQEIVFLQDPSESHPHDSDIRLFEQAVLSKDVKVRLATNLDSARLLIGV